MRFLLEDVARQILFFLFFFCFLTSTETVFFSFFLLLCIVAMHFCTRQIMPNDNSIYLNGNSSTGQTQCYWWMLQNIIAIVVVEACTHTHTRSKKIVHLHFPIKCFVYHSFVPLPMCTSNDKEHDLLQSFSQCFNFFFWI